MKLELSLLAILLLVLLIFSQIVYPKLQTILESATEAKSFQKVGR